MVTAQLLPAVPRHSWLRTMVAVLQPVLLQLYCNPWLSLPVNTAFSFTAAFFSNTKLT
jgi:hypothetical protein